MSSEILINVRPSESRVAHLKNQSVCDLKVERKTSPTMVGTVYVGKVTRVLPGMQAAFVDVGLERAAFLYVGDVRADVRDNESLLRKAEADDPATEAELDDEEEKSPRSSGEDRPKIEEVLTAGQKILVQVAKDPIGTKGARLTTHISLPGRSLVYMPTVDHVGVSRRIEGEEERERLKSLIENLKPKGGVIVRTAGEGAQEEALRADLEYLERLWQDIYQKYRNSSSAGPLHTELSVELRALRDWLYPGVKRVLVDDEATFKKVSSFVRKFMPRYQDKIELYKKREPLFDRYEVEFEISRALSRKVWLKSGGYIVFDEAEAFTVVDVNTGKYVGKKDLGETIFKTNMEAAKEIAHQIRLRNSGGIVVIDFIDMEKIAHRERVLAALQEEVREDPAKVSILSMTELGLVEMTRKRMRPSLIKTLCEPCPYCEGAGYVRKKVTVAQEIFLALEREGGQRGSSGTIVVRCHADVVHWIYSEEGEMIEFLEARLGRSLAFKAEPDFHVEEFEVSTQGEPSGRSSRRF